MICVMSTEIPFSFDQKFVRPSPSLSVCVCIFLFDVAMQEVEIECPGDDVSQTKGRSRILQKRIKTSVRLQTSAERFRGARAPLGGSHCNCKRERLR